MASSIDPTKPLDSVPASKADLRANLQAAKAGIEAGQSTNASTAITVNAASFGAHEFISLQCTASSPVTVTLANDVPAGKALELVRYGAGNVTAQAGAGATLVKPPSSTLATTEQYEAMHFIVDANIASDAVWRLAARP